MNSFDRYRRSTILAGHIALAAALVAPAIFAPAAGHASSPPIPVYRYRLEDLNGPWAPTFGCIAKENQANRHSYDYHHSGTGAFFGTLFSLLIPGSHHDSDLTDWTSCSAIEDFQITVHDFVGSQGRDKAPVAIVAIPLDGKTIREDGDPFFTFPLCHRSKADLDAQEDKILAHLHPAHAACPGTSLRSVHAQEAPTPPADDGLSSADESSSATKSVTPNPDPVSAPPLQSESASGIF